MRNVAVLIAIALLSASAWAQNPTKLNLAQHSKPPGTNGQLLYNNNGAVDAEDPIVSYNYTNLMTTQAATGTVAGSAVRLSTFGGYGTLYVTYASITGSPSACTIQLKNFDSLGNGLNNGSTISTSPSNGTVSFAVSSAAALATAAQISATFACSVYASAGTISIDYVPGIVVGIVNIPAVTQSGTWTNRLVGNAGANLDAATGAAPPANAILHAGLGSGLTGGQLIAVAVGDTYKNINISTATTTLLVSGVSGRQVRITSLHMLTTLANNVALIEGTGATCGTGTAGMAGGTTAASGYNWPANGGIALGNGLGMVLQTATAGDSVCAVTSASTQLSGGISYAIY